MPEHTEGNYPAMLPIIHDEGENQRYPNGINLVVLPREGGQWEVETIDLEQYAAHPRRQKGAIKVRDVASFVAYIQRHNDIGTIAFAGTDGIITAVLNHHEPVDLAEGDAGWRDHTVTLERELHTAFKAWTQRNNAWLSQEQFAEFLETRMGEIITPAGAELFEIAEFFQANTSIGFSSSKLLSNGRVQLHYTEDIAATGGKEGDKQVPTEFTIQLRPYRDSKPPEAGQPDHEQFIVKAKLRYRLQQGKVSFMFILGEELESFMDALHDDVIREVAEATGITVLRGQQL